MSQSQDQKSMPSYLGTYDSSSHALIGEALGLSGFGAKMARKDLFERSLHSGEGIPDIRAYSDRNSSIANVSNYVLLSLVNKFKSIGKVKPAKPVIGFQNPIEHSQDTVYSRLRALQKNPRDLTFYYNQL